MGRMPLIGRLEEKQLLRKYYDSSKSEFVAVYGRRRVGKTYLIRETLGHVLDYEFSGMYQTSSSIQREEFQKELNRRNNTGAITPKN